MKRRLPLSAKGCLLAFCWFALGPRCLRTSPK